MSVIARRAFFVGAPSLLVVSQFGATKAKADPSVDSNQSYEGALEQLDKALFPNGLLALVGAVLGGLVGFALRENPLAILASAAGGTIVGGVDRAAEHYVQSRRRAYDNYKPAIQNSCLGDQRADLHHVAPMVELIDRSHEEISPLVGDIWDRLNRFAANRDDGPLSESERDALSSLPHALDVLGSKTVKLAGHVAKHRDVHPVYSVIGAEIGVDRDERFIEQAEISRQQAQRQAEALLGSSKKLADSMALVRKLNGQPSG